MKLKVYNSWYLLEDYDNIDNILSSEYDYNILNFEKEKYLENNSNIIDCFLENSDRLLFCIIEEQLNCLREKDKKFIKERTICVNNEWGYNIPKPKHEIPKIRWYEALNKSDTIQILRDDWQFTCAIVHKNREISDAKYILNVDEGDECNILHINEGINGDFFNVVLPKLKILLEDQLQVIDER